MGVDKNNGAIDKVSSDGAVNGAARSNSPLLRGTLPFAAAVVLCAAIAAACVCLVVWMSLSAASRGGETVVNIARDFLTPTVSIETKVYSALGELRKTPKQIVATAEFDMIFNESSSKKCYCHKQRLDFFYILTISLLPD